MKKRLLAAALAALMLCGCAPRAYDGPTEEKAVLVEHTSTQYLGEMFGSWTYRTTYAYDTWGNRVEERYYTDDELVNVYKYSFDDQGRQTGATHWDYSDTIPHISVRYKHTRDEQGRVISDVRTDFWGKEKYRVDYSYDDEANTMTVIYSNNITEVHYMDENGNTVRTCQTSESEGGYREAETLYTYDENGNQLSWHCYIDGKLDSYLQSTFDDRGRKTYSARYNGDGTVQNEWSYSYTDTDTTSTIHYTDGSCRISYLNRDGTLARTEDYNAAGELTQTQSYVYRVILVPAGKE